jgi:2-polyprenyl-6-hydroxyphenyl methylase/3-demethylubiquinone-9 3-methyltransferase
MASSSVDPDEIARFSALAESWWNPHGPMRPLHRLNPARLLYLRRRLEPLFGLDPRSLRPLAGLSVLDVGCGAGLLSEPLARLGAAVTAIDASAEMVEAARLHAAQSGLEIDYRCAAAEELVTAGERFDVVVSMEVVEHVADLAAFERALVALTRPGGALALSTLNRTARAFALAIVGAEWTLRWLPRGTHDWRRFVTPAELRRGLKRAGAELLDVTGLALDLRSGEWRLSNDASVNYLAVAKRVDQP